jgi:cytochrome c biogenesis protein ResB
MFKNQKLPFKHVRKSIYQTNHFSGEMISASGRDFKFSRNIIPHEWDVERTRLKKEVLKFNVENLPKINLRLSELEHITQVKNFIKK